MDQSEACYEIELMKDSLNPFNRHVSAVRRLPVFVALSNGNDIDSKSSIIAKSTSQETQIPFWNDDSNEPLHCPTLDSTSLEQGEVRKLTKTNDAKILENYYFSKDYSSLPEMSFGNNYGLLSSDLDEENNLSSVSTDWHSRLLPTLGREADEILEMIQHHDSVHRKADMLQRSYHAFYDLVVTEIIKHNKTFESVADFFVYDNEEQKEEVQAAWKSYCALEGKQSSIKEFSALLARFKV